MSSSNNQFRLALPDGWSDQSIFVFSGPELHGMRHLLRLVIDPNVARSESTESFAHQRIDMVKQGLGVVETLKDETKTLPNGVAAWEWIYKTVPPDQKPIFQQYIYVLLDGRGYTFSTTYSKSSFKVLAGQIEQIITSFTPLPA